MNQQIPIVLLVEDEPLITFALEEELKEAGFQVVSIAESTSALEYIERQDVLYRALITDVDLGGDVTGWELGRRARELNPHLPVIYTSGKSAIDWTAHGVPNSIMLQKPFVFAQLLTALANLLNEEPPSESKPLEL